ncbi:type II toxin-antitoxin system RelE/ParE family toxin [Xenorhabdus bovienii]|uniref:type II toxin-antitoxin system RelE/ParE family toxin n=1 Tax=Xenorhabdus bovienii TaxID=40576 RepID=UPI00237D21DC|nr:type II toxin-antitoxin system RelE/ParE family toxin [Xenorhabdus bovienii]MDE1497079.1 type II toxin-antitoxin system RelE/ParE family toxin [Xenorhabdus bovienii]MDE9447478.1 type II toxin-antitoxin system RelE/ParE family toxin [Xenorhabdus bovienii]MDE9475022.1 type II toxin-antitoxin system RelE/ParE family toxin [Xenorhabdus bovienii]
MENVVWEEDALDDRINIFEYLYQYNPQAAEKTELIFEKQDGLLALQPYLGVCKNGWNGFCLVLADVPFNIYYDVDGNIVRIMRVLHQKQRFPL